MNMNTLNERLHFIEKRRQQLMSLLENEIEYLDQHKINHQLTLSYDNSTVRSIDSYKRLKAQLVDKHYSENINTAIASLNQSNGSQFFKKSSAKIGIIADEFLFNSYKDVAEITYISRNMDKDELKNMDLVVIASAWKGIHHDWKGLANPKSRAREELFELINYLRDSSIKVVFYSKEDPTNYEKFVGIAQKCDYIFTTAIEKIDDYKRDCKTDKVEVLEFGVNPIYNNPINLNKIEKFKEAIFAGSWYEKYPHRIEDTRILFDGFLKSGKGLKIIDRNFDLDLPNHYFPEKYLSSISPGLPHEVLQKTFKLYDWVINLNSVKDSETMFANRVYELQAMGNAIISNYSMGINNKFPNVFMAHAVEEVPAIVNNISEEELFEQKILGVRNVLREHTTFHRINELLSKTNTEGVVNYEKSIAVVVDKITEKARENFNRQTYPFKNLMTKDELSKDYNQYDYITFFDDRFFYEEFYLEDMINGFKYTDSNYITKQAYLINGSKKNGVEHDYVSNIESKFTTVFVATSYNCEFLVELNGPTELPKGYSIDYLELQEGELYQHNSKATKYDLSVIIPVYNNGEHLLSKCFLSLRRSTIFNNMEIILVDDGSTDEMTLNVINRLCRKYNNVSKYCFNDGGSGSASRPRNKGIELASTDYITYLDPDNEAINDGYAKLLHELRNDTTIDMVVGNIIKFDQVKKNLNYTYNIMRWNSTGIVENTYQFLKETKMKAQSIQALIVKKEIIVNNNLKMVEKATGQDTLFFQELLLHSKKIKGINEMIHIYYAAVSNSVTNTISQNFFNKYLRLEKERFPFLKKHKLLNVYMHDRFNIYFSKWYLARVPRIKDENLPEALEALGEIYSIYKPYIVDEPENIRMFYKLLKKKKYKEIKQYYTEFEKL